MCTDDELSISWYILNWLDGTEAIFPEASMKSMLESWFPSNSGSKKLMKNATPSSSELSLHVVKNKRANKTWNMIPDFYPFKDKVVLITLPKKKFYFFGLAAFNDNAEA